jgi:threonyl-tRNA synthetase
MTPLVAAGFRVEIDEANESVGKKIRNATTQKAPYILVIGEKEIENSTVAVRSRDKGELGEMSLDAFKEMIATEIANKK